MEWKLKLELKHFKNFTKFSVASLRSEKFRIPAGFIGNRLLLDELRFSFVIVVKKNDYISTQTLKIIKYTIHLSQI